jgi:hypothetical protein
MHNAGLFKFFPYIVQNAMQNFTDDTTLSK